MYGIHTCVAHFKNSPVDRDPQKALRILSSKVSPDCCHSLIVTNRSNPRLTRLSQIKMTPSEIDSMLKALTLKDLRIQLRVRNESPAGGIEALRQRLKDVMLETKDFALKNDDGSDMATVHVTAGLASSELSSGNLKNNYTRPAGQNVGKEITLA